MNLLSYELFVCRLSSCVPKYRYRTSSTCTAKETDCENQRFIKKTSRHIISIHLKLYFGDGR